MTDPTFSSGARFSALLVLMAASATAGAQEIKVGMSGALTGPS